MENKIIARINKNAQEELIVQLTNFKGHDLIDIRVWLKALPYEEKGNSIATRRGISLRVDAIPDLVKALKKAKEAYKIQNERNDNHRSNRGS